MKEIAAKRWTVPEEIRGRVLRLWERGDVLVSALENRGLFPLSISIRGPSSSEISSDFSAAQQWITEWRGQTEIDCEWKTFAHRLFGTNKMPSAALFPDVDSVITFLGVSKDWNAFLKIIEETKSTFPELMPWLRQRPMRALELASDWNRVLAILIWVRNHPRSEIFLRQMDVPGVHTKFIETQRGVIAELLDLVLPQEVISADARGAANFNRRYGFCDKPERIRLRFLDRACAIEPLQIGLDITVTARAFAGLNPNVSTVFITENETNFLAFPDHPRSLVLFGSGYGWSALDGADWLHRCEVHYWGDIDTHGFAILDQLRSHLPNAKSFLMDIRTLESLSTLAGVENDTVRRPLFRLSSEEKTAFARLQKTPGLRIEQEHIPYSMVEAALAALSKVEG